MFNASSKKITFTDTFGIDEKYLPVPASKNIPEWYKKSKEYVNDQKIIVDGNTPHTIKKCIPVFDALSAGYIIKTYVDVQVTQRDGLPHYEWPGFDAISFHIIEQAMDHPQHNGAPYPKWSNPWSIQTPSGFSCLFTNPMHNPNGIFTIFPGIVDTDKYISPVNFPFVLNDRTWEGIIPAGTAIAQVIPFHRNEWSMQFGNEKNLQKIAKTSTRLRSIWFNSYKKQFWDRKKYR